MRIRGSSSPDSTAGIRSGSGPSRAALQLLRKAPRTAEKDVTLKAGVAAVRYALNLDQTEDAVEALVLLNREFPRDSEVLYVTRRTRSRTLT